MALEKEIETYKNNLAGLASSEGKFVLIQGDQVKGIFDTYADAIKEGYEKCGLDPFLVKQIQTVERIQFVSRLIKPCLTSPSR